MSPVPSRRLHAGLHAVTGGLLLLAAWLLGWRLELALHLGALRQPLAALGAIVLLLGLLGRSTRMRRWSTRCCLGVLAGLLAVGGTELCFRGVGFDFRFQRAFWERTPPNWRKPTVATGTVFFRHEGNVVWTGRVLPTALALHHYPTAPYADVEPITLRYDPFGFRNEPRPEAWSIAVAGDSFTELGDVPFEGLFTTRLARATGRRVLNLGVGNTGPLTQLSYLRDYGLSPATREVMIVFFEGNDLNDLAEECAAEERFLATGRRPYREFKPQTSFLRAVGELLRRPRGADREVNPPLDAWFQGRHGEIPVTLGYTPGDWETLEPKLREALADFVQRYGAFARTNHVRPWLAYMPSKQRVLYGHLRYRSDLDPRIRDWEPSDLPGRLACLAETHGIHFLDLTPPLASQTAATGELLYNHLYDSHLNAAGAAVAGEFLADQFQE